MTPREISAELARLHGVAKSLLQSIEALKMRIDVLVQKADATIPPPTRPTTRIRKPAMGRSVTAPDLAVTRDERDGLDGRNESDVPRESNTSGAYRYVPSPKKR